MMTANNMMSERVKNNTHKERERRGIKLVFVYNRRMNVAGCNFNLLAVATFCSFWVSTAPPVVCCCTCLFVRPSAKLLWIFLIVSCTLLLKEGPGRLSE